MRSTVFAAALIACGLILLVPTSAAQNDPQMRQNRIVDLLSRPRVVFGLFAPARTPETARTAAADARLDFIFFDMEQVESYRPEDVRAFMAGLVEGGLRKNPHSHPLMTRLPPFHADPDAARRRTAEMLNLGVHAIVFPGMESGEEAEQAIAALRYAQPAGSEHPHPPGVRPPGVGEAPAWWAMPPEQYRRKADVYPINPEGELAVVFIIESVKGIESSRAITRTRPTIAIPGPGTLRRVLDGDMDKVEHAIQTQLASCKEFDVPCGITAGPHDVARRIQEGFRVIIAYDRDYAETIALGRRAAGRG